jgi:hypothetical protein
VVTTLSAFDGYSLDTNLTMLLENIPQTETLALVEEIANLAQLYYSHAQTIVVLLLQSLLGIM